MPIKKEVIENILSIHFEDISKYLKYDDYYVLYMLYAQKDIDILKRKCLYCKNIPICPVNICYKKNNEKYLCNQSLINPICYTCVMENWIRNYNKLKFEIRLNMGYICPYQCCKFKKDNKNQKVILNRYDAKYIKFDISWNKFKKINYFKCKYCKLIFRNKYHYDIFKHYKFSDCKFIFNKFERGLYSTQQYLINYKSDDYFSDSELDYDL